MNKMIPGTTSHISWPMFSWCTGSLHPQNGKIINGSYRKAVVCLILSLHLNFWVCRDPLYSYPSLWNFNIEDSSCWHMNKQDVLYDPQLQRLHWHQHKWLLALCFLGDRSHHSRSANMTGLWATLYALFWLEGHFLSETEPPIRKRLLPSVIFWSWNSRETFITQCIKYNLDSFSDTSCFLGGEINKLHLLLSNPYDCMLAHTCSLSYPTLTSCSFIIPYSKFIYRGSVLSAQIEKLPCLTAAFLPVCLDQKISPKKFVLNITCCSPQTVPLAAHQVP